MPLYRVFAHETIYYQYLVLADDEEEAIERANALDVVDEPDVTDESRLLIDYLEVEDEDA